MTIFFLVQIEHEAKDNVDRTLVLLNFLLWYKIKDVKLYFGIKKRILKMGLANISSP